MSPPTLPPGTHPGAVDLEIADLDRSLEWYERVLGLDRLDPSGDPADAVLGVADDSRPLVRLHEHPGAIPTLPREQWVFRGDELVMTTEPLDLESLADAGTGAPWRSIPAGSVMGHVHLHVGDLERAEAFYHAALGLDRMVWSYPGALFMSAGGYHHHLAVNTWARGAPPATEGDARLREWELQIPDPAARTAALARLEDAGHTVDRTDRGARIPDPWHTVLRIRE